MQRKLTIYLISVWNKTRTAPDRQTPGRIRRRLKKGTHRVETAVITGATSGIGAAFAREFAGKGLNLLITGRRRKEIGEFAEKLRSEYSVQVDVIIAEMSDSAQMDALVEAVSKLPEVSALVNNAGYGMVCYFSENPAQHLSMLSVHVTAAMRLIEAVVPRMIAAQSGVIINVSSVAAFFPIPKGSTYAATKRYMVVFSESLHMDLGRYNIRIQALCPGLTKTDFHMRAPSEAEHITRRKIIGWMDPATVARRSLRNLSKSRVVYVPGLINKLLVYLLSHMPRRLYYGLASRVLG